MQTPPPLALVVWHDAHFMRGASDVDKPWTVSYSAGFIIRDDDDCIKLAMSIYPDEQDDDELERGKPQEILTIPRAMVQTVRTVRSFNRKE